MKNLKKINNKTRDKLIKMSGGYTSREYNQLLDLCHEIQEEQKSRSESILSANTALYKGLTDLENFAKQTLYGEDSKVWAKRMYDCIHLNRMKLVMFYLLNPVTTYKIDVSLDDISKVKNFQRNSAEEYVPPMTKEELQAELDSFKPREERDEENVEKILELVENKKELD